MILLTLMIVIVGIVILIQTRKKRQQAVASEPEIPTVSLQEVLPSEDVSSPESALQVPEPQPQEAVAQRAGGQLLRSVAQGGVHGRIPNQDAVAD